jgi:hypothetical protein
MITETNDSSMPFGFVYDDEEWSAVIAALPVPLADGANLDDERRELESFAHTYLNLVFHHRRQFKDGSVTSRWKQNRKQIAADLAKAEKAGCVASVLADLRDELRHADVGVDAWNYIGKRHKGRQNLERDQLYNAALTAWTRLGGKMGLTRGLYGRAEPSGPVIDFMTAVLTPITKNNTPGAEALAKFVKKMRKAKRLKGGKLKTASAA